MLSFASRLRQNPVIPVLTIPEIKHAEPLAKVLEMAGLEFIEVTLRTECAIEAMVIMKEVAPNLKIGAGTVLTEGDVDACVKIGTDFIVTPGSSPELRTSLLKLDMDVMVGVTTATEVMSRIEEGFGVLKFFPAEQFGGAATLKAYSAPLKAAKFCPTGGVTLEKIPQYLELPNVVAVGGTWVAPANLLIEGNFDKILENAKLAAKFAIK